MATGMGSVRDVGHSTGSCASYLAWRSPLMVRMLDGVRTPCVRTPCVRTPCVRTPCASTLPCLHKRLCAGRSCHGREGFRITNGAREGQGKETEVASIIPDQWVLRDAHLRPGAGSSSYFTSGLCLPVVVSRGQDTDYGVILRTHAAMTHHACATQTLLSNQVMSSNRGQYPSSCCSFSDMIRRPPL